MNKLATIPDKELNTLKTQISARQKAMATKEGAKEAAGVMIAMFDYFQLSGYRLPDVDYKKMAAAYADQLKDCIITYGYDTIKQAAREYIKRNDSGYNQLPTAGQLIAVVKSIAGDPLIEIKRRELEEWIREDDRKVHERLLKEARNEQGNTNR